MQLYIRYELTSADKALHNIYIRSTCLFLETCVQEASCLLNAIPLGTCEKAKACEYRVFVKFK